MAGRKQPAARWPPAALEAQGASTTLEEDGSLSVRGLEASAIGDLAANVPAVLHELATHSASLEEAFMEITEDSLEYHGWRYPADSESIGDRP
jgi:hypothetical protein